MEHKNVNKSSKFYVLSKFKKLETPKQFKRQRLLEQKSFFMAVSQFKK